MKIISPFKDYYDHALAWTSDDEIIYRREMLHLSYIPKNEYGFSNSSFTELISIEFLEVLEICLVFFCGKCHTFMHYKDHRQKNPQSQIAYNDEIEKLIDEIEKFRYYAQDSIGIFVGLSVDKLDSFYQTYNTPVFVFSKKGMTINPCLKNFQFQKVVDSYQAFQEIAQFLLRVLITSENPTNTLSNQDTIIKQGFDINWSFREEPQPKKKKKDK